MIAFLSKLFGGSKSDKDVKLIQPLVGEVNAHFQAMASLTNDELRNKTQEFRARIKEYLADIDNQIADKKAEADQLEDFQGREDIYNDVDKLVKTRDQQIEEVLKEIMPEAFAVVKETSRRFATNTEIVSTATDLDRELAVEKGHIT